MTEPPIELVGVGVSYPSPHGDVDALTEVSASFAARSTTAIVGRSGSGKSSLVAVAALMRPPTRGTVKVAGVPAPTHPEQRARVRAATIGMVFQSFHLDPRLTARENCALAWLVGTVRLRRSESAGRANELLDLVGIGALADRRVGEMSGGERQRVAIARALFARPPVLVADEPTGNLDEENAGAVATLLYGLSRDCGTTVVLVTHDSEIARGADQVITLERGLLVHTEAVNT